MSDRWGLVRPHRRAFLAAATAAIPALTHPAWRLWAADAAGGGALVSRQKDPNNLEAPFSAVDNFITPNERFFVRNHFAQPQLDANTWRLKVEGAVAQPLELSYGDLRKLPSRTQTATLECAGNGRAFLTPKAKGVQWELGAVSNAAWTGVPLAVLLEKAGVKSNAVDVVLVGADSGTVGEAPQWPATFPFARSLPLDKARRTEVVLAHQMNGKTLPPEHGYPLRAVVPGWYGVASVKWLTRILVTEKPFEGYFQTVDYTTVERQNGVPSLKPITEMQPKASIARPVAGDTVAANANVRVEGAAWAAGEVAKVEISTDGGKTWHPAMLTGKAEPFAWRLWEYTWRTQAHPGKTTLMARATDDQGRVQPLERDPDRRHYVISHVLPVEVTVR
jgi:DMSO/TMAO reductase YedYZ molybdopterin-dependent catalytic subunit